VANFVTRRTSVAPSESLRHLLKLHVQSQLRFAGAATAVKLPRGASAELWIDIHVVDFVNEAATMWSLVENQCATRCADRQMSAGNRRFYDWQDDVVCVEDHHNGPSKKNNDDDDGGNETKEAVCCKCQVLSAVDYARQTLEFAASSIEDPRLFPTDERTPYPPDFLAHARKICVDLVRVYAHVYHSHFSAIVALRCDQVVNDVFRRFVLFVLEFDLVDKVELQPLDELLRNLLRRPTPQPTLPPPVTEGPTPLLETAPPPSSDPALTADNSAAPQQQQQQQPPMGNLKPALSTVHESAYEEVPEPRLSSEPERTSTSSAGGGGPQHDANTASQ